MSKTAAQEKIAQEKVNQAKIGGDELARRFRTHQRGEQQAAGNSLASCILPFLETLGWHGDLRDVLEAFPHFANDIDLVNLRNAFVALGYESQPVKTKIADIDERFLPCLFEDEESGEALPILGKSGSHYQVWRNGRLTELTVGECQRLGTAYYFTKLKQSGAEERPHIWGWFGHVLSRFKQSLKILLLTSLFTNVLAVVFPLFIMFIYDSVIGAQSTKGLPFIILGIALVLGVDLGLRVIRSRLLGMIAGRLDYLLGVATFEKILTLPPAYTENAAVSVQMSRIKEFESLRDFFTGPLATVTFELPFIVPMILVVAFIAGPLAFIPVVTLVLFAVMTFFVIPRARQLSLETGRTSAAREDLATETLLSLRAIKEAGTEDIWKHRFRTLSSMAADGRRRTEVNNALTDAASQMLMMMSGAAILYFGAEAVLTGSATVGALIASMILSWRILSPLSTGFIAYTKFDQIKKSIMQLNSLMRLRPEGNTGKARLLNKSHIGEITFNRVSFRYSSDSDPALMGASFEIHEGEFIAIIGSSSAGKTTILKMIAGMYQPQGGTITIGGLDLRQIDPRDLRRQIAYVPQETDIFYGTIAQNLRLSDPMASDADLREVTDEVGLLAQIEALPKGFETRIGVGNTDDLAPGFLQRLGIARALLRKSSILLLDEPAQALDKAGDADLVALLNALKGNRTVLMISHRPSHIKMADRAILVADGIVQFDGAPEQALTLSQVFRSA